MFGLVELNGVVRVSNAEQRHEFARALVNSRDVVVVGCELELDKVARDGALAVGAQTVDLVAGVAILKLEKQIVVVVFLKTPVDLFGARGGLGLLGPTTALAVSAVFKEAAQRRPARARLPFRVLGTGRGGGSIAAG